MLSTRFHSIYDLNPPEVEIHIDDYEKTDTDLKNEYELLFEIDTVFTKLEQEELENQIKHEPRVS